MTEDQQAILFLAMFYGGAILSFIFWLWATIDALKSKFESDTIKVMWVIILFAIPILGVIFYFFIGRKQKLRKSEE